MGKEITRISKENKMNIGDKIGLLTIIGEGNRILAGNKTNRTISTWICRCDCGKVIIKRYDHLINRSVKSCGCLKHSSKSSLKAGEKVNRLILIEYLGGRWRCKCECGKEVIVLTKSLNSGNTKSCGCLNLEIATKNVLKLVDKVRKYDPKIATARRIWKKIYYNRDKVFGIESLTFEEFMDISQKNCFYCGIAPFHKYNYFSKAISSQFAKDNGEFIYNGLDRIDSSKYHTIDNVVPCCFNCNTAKNNLTTEKFLEIVRSYRLEEFKEYDIKRLILPNFPKLASINEIYNRTYADGDLNLLEFYSLSQENCFYCGSLPGNIFNRALYRKNASENSIKKGGFIYNGLDRIDSNLPHNKNNVVPCCKYCNFAKSNLSLEEFYNWIKRIKEYQK
jgi:5-methylcytosine-specific restriction endonuclease McrA